MQIVSFGDSLHEKSKPFFLEKYEKYHLICHLLNLPKVVKIQLCFFIYILQSMNSDDTSKVFEQEVKAQALGQYVRKKKVLV